MAKKNIFINQMIILAVILSACGASQNNGRTVTVDEIVNDVRARASTEASYAPASVGEQLSVGGEVKSGDASKARLQILPDDTLIYVGPNTIFTLTELKTDDTGNLFSRLKLELGQLWIVLGGGSLEVETPGGMASVRGSYMGVLFTPDNNELTVTCLEGHCNLTNTAGSNEMIGGQACDVTPDDPACQTRPLTEYENQDWQENVPESGEVPTETPTPTLTPTLTPTPQSFSGTNDLGPQIDDFPPGINPLTGLPVTDPLLLDLPAVMISIPLFPASGRPSAGLSYTPWIFEIYIGEGTTRLLATFYGEEPKVDPPLTGSCEVRSQPFISSEAVLGNRAWVDENRDGIQDPNEPGIGGICVTLYDSAGNVLQTTSTDSNGYYGFAAVPGQTYIIGFETSQGFELTTPDVGYDDLDSDADPVTGLTPLIVFAGTDMNWDAGYIPVELPAEPTPTVGPGTPSPVPGPSGSGISNLPPPEVGPIRSMRLPYGRIGGFFQGGCIVSASGDPAVLARVPGCKYVLGDDSNVNNALLDITELRKLAEGNQKDYPINYSGNIFSPIPPASGNPASEVNVFWNWTDQSQFLYDQLSGAYQRLANRPGEELVYTPQTDRLTGRQLLYQNVIVMYVEHNARAETLIDINLSIGQMGRADLFRNGQVYRIFWSTIAQEYEQETQRLRPIRFTDADGNPFPLAPGHTWVHIFTPASYIYEKVPGSGVWKATFMAPAVP